MPSYAAALRYGDAPDASASRPGGVAPIPRLARLIADFHTTINAPALLYFEGNIDRFLVFCLLLRTSMSRAERDGTISVHSAALSLGRPFETVRRHICALVEAGTCERTPHGVTMSAAFWSNPENEARLRFAHDCFVRLVCDGVADGVFATPDATPPADGGAFTLRDGVCAACDLLLALIDGNRELCAEATDLAIFSAILHANAQRFEHDGGRPTRLMPHHAVRVAQVARTLSLPDTTVRRRVMPMIGPGRLYERSRQGLMVAIDQLCCFDTLSSVEPRHGSVRLILNRAVSMGLSLSDPASAYMTGRPASPPVD